MQNARRATRWRHGVAGFVAVGLALSAAVLPAIGRAAAEDPLSDPTATTVPESPTTEVTTTEVTTTEVTTTETTTTETTLPTPTAPEPTVPGDATTTTVAETSTTVATTIEPPTTPPAVEPAAASAPFGGASALTGLTLAIADPFSVSPTSLAFGSYAVGSTATEVVTIVNTTGREVFFEAAGVAGVSVTGIAGCGAFLPPAGTIASLYLDVDQSCDISVTIRTAVTGSIAGQLIFTDTDSISTAFADVTADVVPPVAPANDNWANAQDLSSLSIPAFVGEPGQFPGTQQPRDTVEVPGSTEFATYEPGEYDPGRPGGSLWYRYTSPPGGFAGRLGYRATPGFFVEVSTDNTSAAESLRAKGNTWPPSSIQHVRMEPGHTVYFSVYNESPFVDPGQFRLELFQAPNEQDSIVEAYSGTGSGEFALSSDFNLATGGDTYHLTPDRAGAPNGWFTLRFAVPGTLSVTHRSATATTLSPFDSDEGSSRPLGLRIYRSPQATQVTDPTVLTEVAVGTSAISDAPDGRISGPRWETTATVALTPGRYYWTFEEASDGPTFFISDVRFRASSVTDTEPPTATITTPPDGARYTVGAVPSSVVATCTDNEGPATSFVTVDGIETTSLATAPGSHTVSLECTDSAGNMSSVTSTYTVTAPPTGPCVIVDTRSVDFGDVAVGSTSPTRAVLVRSCSDAPVRLAVSVSNATGGGGSQTWLAGTSTVPSANEFTWSVTPPGGSSPIPVGSTQTSVGPVLAAGASRTDDHRIRLGPTGPGLGTRFSSTFTYTALSP